MSTTTALQSEINQAEAAANKPDAAAFANALARVEAKATEARAVDLDGSTKFRAENADYTRKEVLKSLDPTLAALKVLNARVVAKENPEQIRAASRNAASLIDASVGLIQIAKCDG